MIMSDIVNVKVREEGTVVDRVSRHSGAMVPGVDRAEAEGLGDRVEIMGVPVVRALRGHVFLGSHTYAPGEERPAPDAHPDRVRELYRLGRIDVTNAAAIGFELPKRDAEAAARPKVKVRAKEAFECKEFPRGLAKKQEVEVPLAWGEEYCWAGLVEPVGWQCRPEPMVLFRVTRPGDLRQGQVTLITEAEAKRWEQEVYGHAIRQGKVRMIAMRDGCDIGPGLPPAEEGDVADVELAIALDLAVKRHARPVGNDVPVTPIAASPKKR
jgi:hypothetical protein